MGAALGLAAAPVTGRAQDLPDHMTVLQTLGAEAADEVLGQLSFPAGATVNLVPETAHPANWLVARILERALVARGFEVHSPAFGREGGAPLAGGTPAAPGRESGEPVRPRGRRGAEGQAGAGSEGGQSTPESQGGAGGQGEPGSAQGGEGQPTGGGAQEEQGAPPAEGADSTRAGSEPPPAAEEPGVAQEAPRATMPVAPSFELDLPEQGEVLTYRVVECGVSYPWIKRSLLVGPQRYGRIAAVRIWASHLTEPGHRVAGTARGERVRIDSFPGWARPLLEGQEYPFPLPVAAGSSLKVVVEPVVVAGVVAGLVYLFYQNQK